jgi:hypothetical protein
MARPDHLTRDDAHFLAAVSGDPALSAAALEDEVGDHIDRCDELGVSPDVDELDIPGDDEGPHAGDEARRIIRGRTREAERQARARDVRAARHAIARGIREGQPHHPTHHPLWPDGRGPFDPAAVTE